MPAGRASARTGAGAAAPSNDAFDAAQTVEGASGQIDGTNSGASKEASEPDHAGEAGGTSVWYRWIAPAGGTLIIDTDGSDFDTLLAVYTGQTLGFLDEVASDDDHIVIAPRSRVVVEAVAGRAYRIAIDGYAADSGTIRMRWELAAAAPVNDSFSAGVPISGTVGPIITTNARATKQPGEPDHAGTVGGASVWYRWTAPASGSVTFDTDGSDFDTVIAVYVGDAVNALTEVASNDDEPSIYPRSAVTFAAAGANRYHVAVDGYEGEVGRISLQWEQAEPTINVVGTTWFSSGEAVLSGTRGSVISAFATGLTPNTSFRLVSSPVSDDLTRRCMTDAVPVSTETRSSNEHGFVPTTSGPLDRPIGAWDVCFLSTDGATIGAPVRFNVVG